MATVVVTVGMGRWPFDRLVSAVGRLAGDHDVFVQTGTSSVQPPCPWERYIAPSELDRRTTEADVVITHAGNTVRTVQRAGLVPVCVAREAARGEMGNDHQVQYLLAEQDTGRAIGVWGDVDALADRLAAVVESHAALAEALIASRPLPPPPDLELAWKHILDRVEPGGRR